MAKMSAERQRERETDATIREACELVHRWLRVASAPPKKRRLLPAEMMRWGVALVDATADLGRPAFRVVTPSGESVILTGALLRSLGHAAVVICDEVIACLDSFEHAEASEPVSSLRITLALGFRRPTPNDQLALEAVLYPHQLSGAIPLLAARRPDGWPR
jgi:hypothetical protein